MKEIHKDTVTILFCTCDSYDDLWEPFFTLLKKNWPSLKWPILFNSESKSFKYSGLDIRVINDEIDLKNSTYGNRMLAHLRAIKTKYTILLLDDFFIRRDVDTGTIDKYLTLMDDNTDIASIYLSPGASTTSYASQLDDTLSMLKEFSMYRLNMQAAIWRTDILKEFWMEQDDPWKWEIFVNYTTFGSKYKFLQVKSADLSPIYYGYNPLGMGVFRGKWVENDVVPLFNKNNITVEYSKRGFYKAEEEKFKFNNKFSLLNYLIKRIGVRYTLAYFAFYVRKYASRFLNIKIKYDSHNELLQEKYDRLQLK